MGKSYWDRGAEQRMDEYLQDGEQTLKTVYQATYEAQKQIEGNIKGIINSFGNPFDMTEDEAKKLLAKPVGQEEYKGLLQQIATLPDGKEKKALLALADSGSAGYPLSQQEAMGVSLQTQVAKIANVEQRELTRLLEKVAGKAYNRSIFDVQKGTGIGFSFSGIDQGAIQEILRNPWSGEHYSSRIGGNGKALQQILEEKLAPCFLNTKSLQQLADELEEAMNVSRHAAARLVRTETAYVANMAQQQSYREMGLERYRFLSTLDNKTSQICQKLDGQVFEVAKAQVGVNVPPMHPHCRSTTVAVIADEELAEMTRWAKDPVTGEQVKVPGDMSYKQWQEDAYGKERVELAKKMAHNDEGDRKEYQGYKEVLGKDNPYMKNFEDFQQIKYLDEEAYGFVKLDYARRNMLLKHPELALPNGNVATTAKEKFTKYIFNEKNNDGWVKGVAVTSRLGYSIDNWGELRTKIISNAPYYPVKIHSQSSFGIHYEQEIVLYGIKRKPANIKVGWTTKEGKTWLVEYYRNNRVPKRLK